MAAAAPPLLEYASIAEVYSRYLDEYVSSSPIEAESGCRIHCYEHHFIHMVKLHEAGKERLWFPDEKAIILATNIGFGSYTHDSLRARRLLFGLECLRHPDQVFRPVRLRTADRAYIKEFAGSLPYPYTVVLVRKEGSRLALCTAQPVKRTDIKHWRAGDQLWPKTPQPPDQVAV
jgi:hypothetical protein